MVGGSRRAHCFRACDRPRWHFPKGCPAGGRLGRAVPSLGGCHSIRFASIPCISSLLGTYVCLYLCVCVCYLYLYIRAQSVRMCVYVGQTEGGMVALSTGGPRIGRQGGRLAFRFYSPQPMRASRFRNSFESLVSDTKVSTASQDWLVLSRRVSV